MDNKGPPDPGGSSNKNYKNIRYEEILNVDHMDTGLANSQGSVNKFLINIPDARDDPLKKLEIKTVSDSAPLNNRNNEPFCNKYEMKYLHLYDAPYYAYIQHNDQNIGRLHPMAIGKLLYEHIKNPKAVIQEITKLGANRIKVTMKTISDINNLIENPVLKENGYIVYVPRHLTERRGVIKGVYTFFSDEYLLDNMECSSKIKYCKRINRRTINSVGQVEYTPTETVVLTFLGNKLPSHVDINGVRCRVDPYIGNVIQCYNCLRFGHVFNQCKAKEKICKNCGITHEGECEKDSTQCIHCKSSTHNSLYKKCPVYVKQQEVKKIMAANNLSFKDAKYVADNPTFAQAVSTKNRFSTLESLNDELVFPSLPSKNNNYTYSSQRKESSSPVPKKRKALSQQEKHFHNPQRDYNTLSLPLTPLPANPCRPSTSKDAPEVVVDNLIKYISDIFYKLKNNFSNEDEDNVRRTVSEMISRLPFSQSLT